MLKKFPGEIEPRSAAAVSPDGKWAVVPCIPHTTEFWKLDPTQLQLWDLSKGELKLSFGDENPFHSLHAFSPDSKFAVSLGIVEKDEANLLLWEIPNGKVLRIIDRLDDCAQVGFSQNGKELVVVGNKILRRLEFKTGKQLWSVPFAKPHGFSILSSDSRRLFLGTGDRVFEFEIWDAENGKKIRELDP